MQKKQLKSFKDLLVWQKSVDLARLIYETTEKFPRSELYGITNQMRRSVISISSNIAEGFKRSHNKEKLQFYNVAYGSIAELESQIEVAYKLRFLNKSDYQKLSLLIIEEGKMINSLIKSTKNRSSKSYILNSIFFSVFLYSIFYILNPFPVSAAILYLAPEIGDYHQGDTFLVDIRLDTEGEYINVADIDLSFPEDSIEVVDFSKGNSVLSLWVEEPNFSNREGKLSFIGGTPGGYQGLDGILGRIALRARETSAKQDAKQTRNTKISFLESSQVLLNDGSGTKANLTIKGALFNILSEGGAPKDDWEKELTEDVFPPELFDAKVEQEPKLFDGRYFIIFSTVDKQTGVDYYEVLESRTKNYESSRNWRVAQSPYLLRDQSLTKYIHIKAVDEAGNYVVVTIHPTYSPKEIPLWIWLLLIGVGAGVSWWIVRKITKPTRNKTRN